MLTVIIYEWKLWLCNESMIIKPISGSNIAFSSTVGETSDYHIPKSGNKLKVAKFIFGFKYDYDMSCFAIG